MASSDRTPDWQTHTHTLINNPVSLFCSVFRTLALVLFDSLSHVAPWSTLSRFTVCWTPAHGWNDNKSHLTWKKRLKVDQTWAKGPSEMIHNTRLVSMWLTWCCGESLKHPGSWTPWTHRWKNRLLLIKHSFYLTCVWGYSDMQAGTARDWTINLCISNWACSL